MLPLTLALLAPKAAPPIIGPILPLPPILLANAIANPGFESGLASWSAAGGTVSYFPYDPNAHGQEASAPYAGQLDAGPPHAGAGSFRLNPAPSVFGQADASRSFLRQALATPVSAGRVVAAGVWTRGLYGGVQVTVRYTQGPPSVGYHGCVYAPQQPWERWSFVGLLDPARAIASVEFECDSLWLNTGGAAPIDVDDVSLTVLGAP